jgi:hypothetical protein
MRTRFFETAKNRRHQENLMMRRFIAGIIVVGCGMLLVGCGDTSTPTPKGPSKSAKGPSASKPTIVVPPTAETKALNAHLADGKYVVLVLHKGEDVTGFTSALTPLTQKFENCASVTASIDDGSLTPMLTSLKLDPGATPTPLAIVIAPNILVSGVFMRPPTEEKLRDALLPEQTLAIRKALSLGKNVIVTMQSPKTTGNAQMKKAVSEFLAEPKRKGKYVSCALDLDKPENLSFLKQLKIDPSKETAAVVLGMAPPLKIVNTPVRKPNNKLDVAKAVDPACGTGCGPSG